MLVKRDGCASIQKFDNNMYDSVHLPAVCGIMLHDMNHFSIVLTAFATF